MDKRKLKKLKSYELDEKYIDQKHLNESCFVAVPRIERFENEKILLIDYYRTSHLHNSRSAVFRAYFDSSDNYTIRNFEEQKWSKSTISTYINLKASYKYRKQCIYKDPSLIQLYFDQVHHPSTVLRQHQDRILGERLEASHKVIKDRIDTALSVVGKVPRDFEDWWIHEVMPKYIFYDYSRKRMVEGHCTYCHFNVKVNKPKHNGSYLCPGCGSYVTLKSNGKSKNIVDRSMACYLQGTDEGMVIRYFRVTKNYKESKSNPRTFQFESKRIVVKGDDWEWFEYGPFLSTGESRWCKDNDWFDVKAILYPKGIKSALKNTIYKYCAIEEYNELNGHRAFGVAGYISKYKEFPALEYFVKLKWKRLTDDLFGWNRNCLYKKGKNINEILKLSKNGIALVNDMDPSFKVLEFIQVVDRLKAPLDASLVFYAAHELRSADELEMVLKHTSILRMRNYLEKHRKLKPNGLVIEWIDYIKDCEKLNYDLNNDFVLFPRDLLKEHRKTSQRITSNKIKEHNEAIRSQEKNLNKMYYTETDMYIIRAPKGSNEFSIEGHTLKICVANYTGDVASGSTTVLFIRKKAEPNKPFATMEVRNNEIVQCQGYGHKDMMDELKPLIKKFTVTKLMKISDRKVG